MADLLYAWSKQTVRDLIADDGPPWELEHVASDQFRRRGLVAGDRIYVIGRGERNEVLLLGRMDVDQVMDQSGAEEVFGSGIWEAADHAVAGDSRTKVRFDRSLTSGNLRALCFTRDRDGQADPKGLDLDPVTGQPKGMALASARWLTADSAALLDGVLTSEPQGSRDPVQIVAEALTDMLWEPSIRFFGWALAVAFGVDPRRTVVTDLRADARFRIYCGVYTTASPYRGLLLASLDERAIDADDIEKARSLGGEVINQPGDSQRVPHSLVLGVPPEHMDEMREVIAPAYRRHCVESAAAGLSGHSSEHRADLLHYLRQEARDLGVGA